MEGLGLPSSVVAQAPFFAFFAAVVFGLLRFIQGLYEEQKKDLRSDRDKWERVAAQAREAADTNARTIQELVARAKSGPP